MRIFKKVLKILSIIIFSIVIFIVLLVVGAKIFESELASYTMSRLEAQVDAPMSIGKVSLIPLFSFPRVSAEIHDLWIGDPKRENTDTLFCITSLKLGLDSWDLIDGIYTIDKVEISGLNFDYTVDTNGKSNIDFLVNAFMDTTQVVDTVMVLPNDTVITPLDLTAEKIKLENIHINYFDNKTKMASKVYIPEINIKAKAKKDYYKGETEGSFILSHLVFGETNVNRMESCKVDFELEYDDNEAIIKYLSVNSEGLDLAMDGNLKLNDTIDINANLTAQELDINILKKYIPEQFLEEFGIIDMSGISDITASIIGKYADSTILPLVEADVNFKNISLQTKEYPEIKSLNLTAQLTNGEKSDMSQAKVKISDLRLNTPESSVFLKGTVSGLENPRYNLNTMVDINLQEFEKYIPDSLAKNIKGTISASLSSFGILPDKISDDFTEYVLDRSSLSLSLFNISALLMDSIPIDNFSTDINYTPNDTLGRKVQIYGLDLKSDTLNINLQNSSVTAFLKGKLTEPDSLKVNLKSFRIQSGDNLVIGSAKIENPSAPVFEFNTNIFLNLEELMAFIPDSLVSNMTGTIKAAIKSKGKIQPDSLKTQLYPLLFENSSFGLVFENVSLQFPDSVMNVDSISARINLQDDELKIDDFIATYNGLSFEMDSTLVKNIYKAVLLNQKEELYVKTQFEIGDIYFDDFQHLMALGSSNATPDTIMANSDIVIDTTITDEFQNWTFLIHGKAAVKSIIIDSTKLEGFNINRLHINDLSTLFKLTDSAYIADQFKFKAFEGEMNNSFHYKKRDDGTQSVSSHNVIKGMNIRTLLRDMDNFGMDSVISHENISGLFSTDLNTFIPVDDSVLINKTLISGDLTLEQGGVYNYEPAQELSKFSGIKELDNIQFKTLHSNIFMFKNKLYVPRTNIVSNAVDIAAFGMQSLENDYEYHLEVHMSNILFGKSKRRNKKQDAVGNEVDEKALKKSSHKLRYAEIEGKRKVGYDTKDARSKMMNKIRVQEKMLGFIFFPKNIHYNTDVNKKH